MTTFRDICTGSEEAGQQLHEYILSWQAQEMGVSAEELTAKLRLALAVMREAVAVGVGPGVRSRSGLSGGDAHRLHSAPAGLMGNLCKAAMSFALATAEVNAAMGRIVAAPTAGASGVVPGVLLAAAESERYEDDDLLRGLIVAGGIGLAIASQATLAGAEGGCQAECGSGAAMAAGALTYLRGGSNGAVGDAVAIALKNQIGLVCDPVAGLVEIPCIKRNAGSAVIALMASDMAMAGISSFIPADEAITAVAEVGRMMPVQFRETGQGGMANTPTGRAAAAGLQSRGQSGRAGQ